MLLSVPDPKLIQAVVRAHVWLRMLSDGTYDSVEQLAKAIDLHPKVIRNRIRLAFLAPAIVKNALLGSAEEKWTDIPKFVDSLNRSEQFFVGEEYRGRQTSPVHAVIFRRARD